ncbi:MAG: class I SAM-dependent methyltransferase [Nanoarchaeota archaeon]
MIQDKSASLSRRLYAKLGKSGMMSLTNKKRDDASIKFILRFIKKSDKILDLACGYGRVSFPLMQKGFDITGVDLSLNLIKEAKEEAKRKNLRIQFKMGDFREIPYPSENFNKIICLWSSFNHLLKKKDQITALNEMYRILKKKGLAVIDFPNGESKWAKEQIKLHGRVVPDIINNLEVFNYFHDKATLKELGNKTKFRQEVKFNNIAGRRRIIWILKKI